MGASERYLSRPWLKHYQEGVPASAEVPLKSVTRMFDEATERAPGRTAVVFYGRSRSEEHTSELQSPCNLVCRLLLEKKKNNQNWDNNLNESQSFTRAQLTDESDLKLTAMSNMCESPNSFQDNLDEKLVEVEIE